MLELQDIVSQTHARCILKGEQQRACMWLQLHNFLSSQNLYYSKLPTRSGGQGANK